MRTMESDCWEAAKIRDEAWAKLPESRANGDHTDCAQIWFKKGDTHALNDYAPVMFYRKVADSIEVFYIEKLRLNALRCPTSWRPTKYPNKQDYYDALFHMYVPAENEWFAGHFTIKLDEQGRKDWEKQFDQTTEGYTLANLKRHSDLGIPHKVPRMGFMSNPWNYPYDLEEEIDIVKNGSGFGEKKTMLLKALETCHIKSNADDWRRIYDLIANSNRCNDADNLYQDIEQGDLAAFQAEDVRGNIPAQNNPKAYIAIEEEIRAFAAKLGIDIDLVNEEKRQKHLAQYGQNQKNRYSWFRYDYCAKHCLIPSDEIIENAKKDNPKVNYEDDKTLYISSYQHYLDSVPNALREGDPKDFLEEQELD